MISTPPTVAAFALAFALEYLCFGVLALAALVVLAWVILVKLKAKPERFLDLDASAADDTKIEEQMITLAVAGGEAKFEIGDRLSSDQTGSQRIVIGSDNTTVHFLEHKKIGEAYQGWTKRSFSRNELLKLLKGSTPIASVYRIYQLSNSLTVKDNVKKITRVAPTDFRALAERSAGKGRFDVAGVVNANGLIIIGKDDKPLFFRNHADLESQRPDLKEMVDKAELFPFGLILDDMNAYAIGHINHQDPTNIPLLAVQRLAASVARANIVMMEKHGRSQDGNGGRR